MYNYFPNKQKITNNIFVNTNEPQKSTQITQNEEKPRFCVNKRNETQKTQKTQNFWKPCNDLRMSKRMNYSNCLLYIFALIAVYITLNDL